MMMEDSIHSRAYVEHEVHFNFKTLIKLFNKTVYEPFLLELMNRSKKIFPGTFSAVEKQSHGECDFICNETMKKYDAKLPLRDYQVEMLTAGKKHAPEIQKWIEMLHHECCEFNPMRQKADPSYDISQTSLYGVMKEQIEKSSPDESIIFFLPFPITEKDKNAIHLLFGNDLLDFIYEKLEADNVLNGRDMYAIYPASGKNEFVLINPRHKGTDEYIVCDMIEEFYSHEVK